MFVKFQAGIILPVRVTRNHADDNQELLSVQVKRYRARIILGLSVAIVAAIFVHGSNRTPTPRAEGTSIQGWYHPDIPEQTFRVASYNIHSGVGTDGRFDLSRTGAQLKDYHFSGLNEVRGAGVFDVADQAEFLGRQQKMSWLFAPTEHQWYRDHFGNCVLCTVPVTKWSRVPLQGTWGRGRRNLVTVQLDLHGRHVNVLVTHLDRTTDRLAQLETVTRAFLEVAEPAILMGDFNTIGADDALRELKRAPGVIDCVSAHGKDGPNRIDWIFAKGLECLDAGIVESNASDHPLVWAEFRVSRDSTIRTR